MIDMTLEMAETAVTGGPSQGPSARQPDDDHRGGRSRTSGAQRAGRWHGLLHARDLASQSRGCRGLPPVRPRRWPRQGAKGWGFWQAMPAVVAGQVLPTAGGSPIVRGGRVIGGIGCGGGTGEQDQECADAGAAALKA